MTTLAASGPGSLQEALSTPGPRIIVFDVSGVIRGDMLIEHGYVTVAGQTAPGGGITVQGRFWADYDDSITDIIIRHVRVRPDNLDGSQGDAMQFSLNKRVILDHVSVAWGADETIDMYEAEDVTVQWCTIEESDTEGHPEGSHNYGFINGPDGKNVSIHHTLFAHHRHRSPAIANGPSDVRNNVVYDFRQGFHHDNPTNGVAINVVGNYYKRGPSSTPVCFNLESNGKYYFKDNFEHGAGMIQNPCANQSGHPCLNQDACKGTVLTSPGQVPAVTTHSPEEAFELVLQQAGAFPRDSVTKRTVEETRAGTGSWGRKDSDDLRAGLTPGVCDVDGDGDGMPDGWETLHGLNPADGEDSSQVMASGYTAIEEYINSLADALVD